MKNRFSILFILALLLFAAQASATIQWANNATSIIADSGGISAGATSMTVYAGHGDRFPAVTAPHYFMATLVDTSGNREIVKVTARTLSSNTMTIERAQESTSARAFAAGSLVELRVTKNALDYLSKAADINENYYIADASAADQGATTNSRSLKSLVAAIGSQQATIVCPHTGTGTTTTYTLGTSLTIPVTITLVIPKGALVSVSVGQTLTMNGIVQAGAYQVFTGSGTATVNTYPQDQAWWGSSQRLDVTAASVTGAVTTGSLAIGGAAIYAMPAGIVFPYLGVAAPTGYLLADGRTIGDGSSGGVSRANADTATLFAFLWDSFANAELAIQDSAGAPSVRGANAAADFAAHKRMPLPDMRGRLPLGKDDLGGSAASRVAAATTLGASGGAASANLAHTHSGVAHTHTITADTSNVPNVVYGTGDLTQNCQSTNHNHGGTTGSDGAGTTSSAGSATQTVMNPYFVVGWIIKY